MKTAKADISINQILPDYPKRLDFGYNNSKLYVFVFPDPYDDYWNSHILVNPKLITIDITDYSYTVNDISSDRYIDEVYYTDEDIVLVGLGGDFPWTNEAWRANPGIFDLNKLQMSEKKIAPILGTIWFDNKEIFY